MKKDLTQSVRETVEVLVVAGLLALFIRTFIVQAFKIPSGSMLQTLQIGDHLLVSKFLYGVKAPFVDKIIIPVSNPERNDIIVFEYPQNPDVDFIKRIVGVPGDTLEIVDKQLYRNGQPVNESFTQFTGSMVYPRPARMPDVLPPDQYAEYFNGKAHMSHRDQMPQITVPEGKYFVMGDNRDGSHDSRFWGFVDREAILGKALFIYWSWENLTDIRWNRLGKVVE
ncbi:signal peptidase I [Salidesulfovibrio brasiliensis]|uniref:signal peptidase I n=1 Tax=Salidesulfovibrio brasiliensis TaxID=221711 RepID=UPI0006D06478|nr:signal peptidase I [Salidesulfovibrio brasiliensis]